MFVTIISQCLLGPYSESIVRPLFCCATNKWLYYTVLDLQHLNRCRRCTTKTQPFYMLLAVVFVDTLCCTTVENKEREFLSIVVATTIAVVRQKRSRIRTLTQPSFDSFLNKYFLKIFLVIEFYHSKKTIYDMCEVGQ